MEKKPMEKLFRIEDLKKQNIEEQIERWEEETIYLGMKLDGLEDLWLFKLHEAIDEEIYKKSGKIQAQEVKKIFQTKTREIYEYSKTDNPLLIIGETGTSKEFLAKLIHDWSDRREKPFKKINCAIGPDSLFESNLFGYVKGAFTDAKKDKPGALKEADGGTVFLDEIGKMPQQSQAKLLRIIEEKVFTALGSNKETNIDVHFIAAVQPRDISGLLHDLFWRFRDWIETPPLRERLKKVPETIQHSLETLKREIKKAEFQDMFIKNPKAIALLRSYEYREGNFRELNRIWMAAIRSARINGRKEIIPVDVEKAMNQNKKLNEYFKSSPPKDKTEANMLGSNVLTEFMRSSWNIKFKDVLGFAEDQARSLRAEIVEKFLISEMKTTGLALKALCNKEGIEYHNFRKKVKTITGKGIKELGL